MGQFNAGIYEILTHDGRQVHAGLFKTADEIFDFVRDQAVGTYEVFKELPPVNGERESELWGYVTNHGERKTSYHRMLPVA
jgi:hypothetical protein